MKAVNIDNYICLDVDQIVIDEMKSILEIKAEKREKEYWDRAKKAAQVIIEVYSVPNQSWVFREDVTPQP